MVCVTKVHKGHDAVDEEEYKAELYKLLEIQRETEIKLSKLALSRVAPGKVDPYQFAVEVKEEQRKPNVKVTRQFTTDLTNIDTVISHSDDTVWIADRVNKTMKHSKLTKDNIQVISKVRTHVFDMSINTDNGVLLSVGGEWVKLLNEGPVRISNSNCNVAPLRTFGIHATKDWKVITGAVTHGSAFTGTGRRVVIVMDEKGNHEKIYEHDRDNKPLFTFPRRITGTSNGNICVIDKLDTSHRGRVVFLGPAGNILHIYTGHPDINSNDSPFRPSGILTTSSDNIIVADFHNHTLHILNCNGVTITYIRTDYLGIMEPFSLCLSINQDISI
ncbi:unnamed protein product [Mytilus coruscus]|uniref:TRIM71 n=1 Tax=Mytilus coruscus TaxID=42192 RepID=A0A6J8A1C6_MYTCO|nr:unnamed protein product [Mytilus coruscus]